MILLAVHLQNLHFRKHKVKVEMVFKLIKIFTLFRDALVENKAMYITTTFR